MYLRLCLFHVSDFPENTYFPEMLFSGKENIFKCLVAFQKMLWKIFSGIWLYGWKCYFPTNFSHGNSTHGSKLWQSKATTTKTPPPHHHNNTKNQNHTEHQNTNKTQKKKIIFQSNWEKKEEREDDRFWGQGRSVLGCDHRDRGRRIGAATAAIGDDESGFAIGDDEGCDSNGDREHQNTTTHATTTTTTKSEIKERK